MATQVMVASGFSPGVSYSPLAALVARYLSQPRRFTTSTSYCHDVCLCDDVLMAGHTMFQGPSQAATPASQGSQSLA